MTLSGLRLRVVLVLKCALFVSSASLSAEVTEGAPYRIAVLKSVGHGIRSTALGISPDGQRVVGRQVAARSEVRPDGLGTIFESMRAMWWSETTGGIALPNYKDELKRKYSQAFAVNDEGVAVGTSTTTYEGLHSLPIRWFNGEPTPFPLPSGYETGRAYAVNASGTAIGSVGWSSNFRPAVFTMAGSTIITSQSDTGRSMYKATGISDGGLVIGESRTDEDLRPSSASLIYNSITGELMDIGALKGDYQSRAYGISSNSKYVAGSSTSRRGNIRPYFWSKESGMVALALPFGTTDGYASAVNDLGWVVGLAWATGGIYEPFLSKDGNTYSLRSLLPQSSPWEFVQSPPTGISNNGKIVGTAVHDGVVTAYAMMPSDRKLTILPSR